MQENAMYKGVTTQLTPLRDWKEKKQDRSNGGWTKEDNWTVASFGRCERSVLIKFKPLS